MCPLLSVGGNKTFRKAYPAGTPVDRMRLTEAVVADEREWIAERASTVVPLLNDVRSDLAAAFDTDIGSVPPETYRAEVDVVFADGDLAVNVAALSGLLRDLDIEDDYPGFVVDELLGRELAGAIAGDQPLRLLGEATFHYADVTTHTEGTAGLDDLDAALAAGFQTRLPGWEWTASESPFAVEPDDPGEPRS